MAFHGEVVSREWLTPGLVRVVLGGPGLAGFTMPDETDTYVNVAIPPAGAGAPDRATGSRIVKTAPPAGGLWARISPPCLVTIS